MYFASVRDYIVGGYCFSADTLKIVEQKNL